MPVSALRVEDSSIEEVRLPVAQRNAAGAYLERTAFPSLTLLSEPEQATAELLTALLPFVKDRGEAFALAQDLGQEVLKHPAAVSGRLFTLSLQKAGARDLQAFVEEGGLMRIVALSPAKSAGARGTLTAQAAAEMCRTMEQDDSGVLVFTAAPGHFVDKDGIDRLREARAEAQAGLAATASREEAKAGQGVVEKKGNLAAEAKAPVTAAVAVVAEKQGVAAQHKQAAIKEGPKAAVEQKVSPVVGGNAAQGASVAAVGSVANNTVATNAVAGRAAAVAARGVGNGQAVQAAGSASVSAASQMTRGAVQGGTAMMGRESVVQKVAAIMAQGIPASANSSAAYMTRASVSGAVAAVSEGSKQQAATVASMAQEKAAVVVSAMASAVGTAEVAVQAQAPVAAAVAQGEAPKGETQAVVQSAAVEAREAKSEIGQVEAVKSEAVKSEVGAVEQKAVEQKGENPVVVAQAAQVVEAVAQKSFEAPVEQRQAQVVELPRQERGGQGVDSRVVYSSQSAHRESGRFSFGADNDNRARQAFSSRMTGSSVGGGEGTSSRQGASGLTQTGQPRTTQTQTNAVKAAAVVGGLAALLAAEGIKGGAVSSSVAKQLAESKKSICGSGSCGCPVCPFDTAKKAQAPAARYNNG